MKKNIVHVNMVASAKFQDSGDAGRGSIEQALFEPYMTDAALQDRGRIAGDHVAPDYVV